MAGFWAAALGYQKQWTWDEATSEEMLAGGLEPERVNSPCAVIDPGGSGIKDLLSAGAGEQAVEESLAS